MNERKTEGIIRDHFAKFEEKDGVFLYEQQSSNPKIQNLLKGASKSGDGDGYPDFIVEFRKHDFLIVIEAKPDTRKHQSPNLDNPKEYAVDGAHLYASHLVKSYDVLSIGVSGTKKSNLKVTHHLFLKNARDPVEILGGDLLSKDNYLKEYLQDPRKLKTDFNELIRFIKNLNHRLHDNKVSEKHRALFISMLLIALKRDSFKNAYKYESSPKSLAEMAVEAAANGLKQEKFDPKRLETLRQNFGFLPHEEELLNKPNELVDIITDIDSHINGYKKNDEYRDVIGELYIEFLRYANSEKKLGIVLTPHHIAEFFVELAEVTKNSVVYDNCTGTGGFLVSAMGKMIKDANRNTATIDHIKKHNIHGVELGNSIYPLAVSNMDIHQDGKSNIIHGNCFNDEIKTFIKGKHPDVGILNPPYKAKKGDTEELEFVINNLDCLQQRGKCVAIVPMQCALTTSKTIIELKDRLMREHTLEAVLSMPNELFFNSKASVVTCAMVFTAHIPHPKGKKVYLGYYKDDGFSKNKLLGRADIHDRWEEIQKIWLEHYRNKKEQAGLSVMKLLKPTDEWCAEAYMETDYSTLTDDDFIRTIKNYTAFQFLHGGDN